MIFLYKYIVHVLNIFFPDGSYDIVNAGVLAALYNNVEDLMVRW